MIVSDTHVNSTVGLCSADGIELDDGGTYHPNKFQKWLWRCWLDFCESVPKGSVIIHNGDVVQGIHSNREHVITTSATRMRRAAVDVLTPLVERASVLYMNRGTDFHDATHGDDLEDIAKEMGAVRNPDTNQWSQWELWLRHEGILFQATHHISIAQVYPKTPMARASNVAKILHADLGYPIPDVQVRSHVHHYDKMPDGDRWIITSPCWQLKGGFIFKVSPQSQPSIGGLIFDQFEKGNIHWQEKLYPLAQPHVRISQSQNSQRKSRK